MVFRQNLLGKAYFVAKMSGLAMVLAGQFWLLESTLSTRSRLSSYCSASITGCPNKFLSAVISMFFLAFPWSSEVLAWFASFLDFAFSLARESWRVCLQTCPERTACGLSCQFHQTLECHSPHPRAREYRMTDNTECPYLQSWKDCRVSCIVWMIEAEKHAAHSLEGC